MSISVPLLSDSMEEDKYFRIRVTRADFPSEVSRSRGDVPVWITGRPRLTTWMWQGDIHLRWRASATNLVLEGSSALEGQPWLPVEGGEFGCGRGRGGRFRGLRRRLGGSSDRGGPGGQRQRVTIARSMMLSMGMPKSASIRGIPPR